VALGFLLGIVAALAVAAAPVHAASSSIMVGVRHSMHATLTTPDGPGPYPGVLVLHTSAGLEDADIRYATRLAQQGYVCLVPAFLEAYGITFRNRQATFTTDAEPIYADLVDALDTLEHLDQVNGEKLAAVGFSNGGYFAVWLAATGKVQAGVAYYGALSGAGTDKSLDHFSRVFNGSSSPVLILHGSADTTVPVQAAQHLAAILDRAHSPYEIQLYPGAGHRFDRDLTSDADRTAAADAWRRTLMFLTKHLKP
jgi:carboxymethylenebutenolidase